jgi:hypothetical protein
MQIKTTLRLHLTPVKIAIIKKPTTVVGEDGGKRNPHTLHWGCKLVQPPWKKIGRLLNKLN